MWTPANFEKPANKVRGFNGINHRKDPTALGLEWQLEARNVLCDNAQYLTRRPGFHVVTLGIKDLYATRDGRVLAIDTADDLVRILPDGTRVTLFAGITGAPFCWAELGNALFLQSSTAMWVVYPDRAIPWGSLCPVPSANTYPLDEPAAYPPPVGQAIAACRSQMVVAVHELARDRTVLYYSRPDHPHEFRLERDYALVPGPVRVLASIPQGIVLATDRAIYLDIEGALQQVADYGAPFHVAVGRHQGQVWFFTYRGLCKAAPFENLTDAALIPTCRERVSVSVFAYQGSTYALAHQTGEVHPQPPGIAAQPLPLLRSFDHGLTA